MRLPVLALFAKSPVPGFVKTRFTPHCSAEKSAQIALGMIKFTVLTAAQSWPGPVCMYISPDKNHPAVKNLCQQHDIALKLQANGDLGRKMELAIRDELANASAVGVMGCDIPQVSGSQLQWAYQQLQQGLNVFGPSADGGFYFIGLQQYIAGMFDNIRWGESTVAQTTINQLTDLGIWFDTILECQQDVDTWDDYQQAIQFVPELQDLIDHQS